MLLAAVILAISGTLGAWLQFPLTGSLKAPMLGGRLIETPLLDSQGALLTIVIALVIAGWLVGLRWLLVACGLALLALAGWFYLDLVAGDQGWLVRFVSESGQRVALENFTEDLYWPNLNPEPTAALVSEFEHLPERIRAAWGAVGKGWLHTVAAGAAILAAVAIGSRLYTLLALAGVLSVALGLVAAGYPLIQAELEHRKGDAYLAAGRPRAALLAYESAIRADPVLAESRPFLVKASYAYLILLGKSSDLAVVYLADTRNTGTPELELTPAMQQRLTDAHLLLKRVGDTLSPAGPLEGAIRRQASTLDSRLWVTQGSMALNAGLPSEALQAFRRALAKNPRALDALFFLGHTELLLGMRQQAITTLARTLALVRNAPIRADVACTLGDALRGETRLTAARSEYARCLALDDIYNFRAVRSLGGT